MAWVKPLQALRNPAQNPIIFKVGDRVAANRTIYYRAGFGRRSLVRRVDAGSEGVVVTTFKNDWDIVSVRFDVLRRTIKCDASSLKLVSDNPAKIRRVRNKQCPICHGSVVLNNVRENAVIFCPHCDAELLLKRRAS